ncbi:hypothetical protein BHM03_00012563, partial [Ensete ventricosum]
TRGTRTSCPCHPGPISRGALLISTYVDAVALAAWALRGCLPDHLFGGDRLPASARQGTRFCHLARVLGQECGASEGPSRIVMAGDHLPASADAGNPDSVPSHASRGVRRSIWRPSSYVGRIDVGPPHEGAPTANRTCSRASCRAQSADTAVGRNGTAQRVLPEPEDPASPLVETKTMEQTRTDDASRFPSRCYFFPPHTSFLRLLSSPSLRERPSASRSSPTKGELSPPTH